MIRTIPSAELKADYSHGLDNYHPRVTERGIASPNQ